MDLNQVEDVTTRAAIIQSLTQSGLLADDALQSAISSSGGNVQVLLNTLVERGMLSPFQLDALREGRVESLRVGNYELLDRLGAGGMGTVFKARHRRMKRVVALKVLASNLSKNAVFVKRFQREVETIACLGHPNVVMAYDADESEVGHFLVMEYVQGRDLAVVVAQDGPMPLSLAVQCTLQAARGLAYAHAQGVVHRDIKPANLLLDNSGAVKVTDLGLARLSHGAEGADAATEVTAAGGVIGTADYMAPEQAIDSTTLDLRADIYSLGCTLYYLLTGRPVYTAPSLMGVLLKHREAEIPSLRATRPDAPPKLVDLYQRMLAKTPEARVQTMEQVQAELEEIASTLPPDTLPSNHAPSSSLKLSPAVAASTCNISDQTVEHAAPSNPASVLIVEPSRVQATIIRRLLAENSFSVVDTASTGADAIAAVRALRPAAVVSAMHLSDISGLELARQIRAEFQSNAPGFVLITSESNDHDSELQNQLNRVLVLPKPFNASQLAQAFRQVTGASGALSGVLEVAAGAKRAGLRVLVVDDSATARAHVRSVLQSLGFKDFLGVPDGAHAIAVAAQEDCDLIVTDYHMPLMDGRALVSYLKQNSATASIPIIVVTSETDPKLLDSVRKLGAFAIVEKAFPAAVVEPLIEALFP